MTSKLGALLRTKIRTSGPVTVAEYMRTCLTDPNAGYYVHGNPIGRSGDFTTAPEISQIFGELISIWCIFEWQRAGFVTKYPKLRVVELGPGKGTLSSDILRTLVHTVRKQEAKSNVELHLVEVSKSLAQAQLSILCGSEQTSEQPPKTATSKFDRIPVFWHSTVDEAIANLRSTSVSSAPAFDVFVANEFFDALPVHKFERVTKTDDWREVLVDCDPQGRLQLVQARRATPSCAYLSQVDVGTRSHVEVALESGRVVQLIARHLADVARAAGACLVVDYGHLGDKQDTLRAFRGHQVAGPLQFEPGECDLTVDVDFAFLKRHVDALHLPVQTFSAIEQRLFLANLGVGYRLQRLLQNAPNSETRSRLIQSVKRLMDQSEMGSRFKVFAFTTNADRESGPAGFVQLA